MSEDESLYEDFVPDTPSPVLNKKHRLCPVSKMAPNPSHGDMREPRENDSASVDQIHNSSSLRSLPGQIGFEEERAEALKRKKKREHLSPFKSAIGSSRIGPFVQLSPIKYSPKHSDFVKSSSLMKSFAECADPVVVNGSGSNHRLVQKRKPSECCEEKSKHRKVCSKIRKDGSKRNSLIRWPSSSESSSDEESLIAKFKTKPLKSHSVCDKASVNHASSNFVKASEDLGSVKASKDPDFVKASEEPESTLRSLELKHKHILHCKRLSHDKLKHCKSKTVSKHRHKLLDDGCRYGKPSSNTHHKSYSKRKSPYGKGTLNTSWHDYMKDDVNQEGDITGQDWSPSMYSALNFPRKTCLSPTCTNSSYLSPKKTQKNVCLLPTTSSVNATSTCGYITPKKLEHAVSCNDELTRRSSGVSAPMISEGTRGTVGQTDTNIEMSTDILSGDGATGTGSRHNPVDVDLITFTPETKKAYQQIQQLQKDEDVARQLQEELDREFAMSLQNQSQEDDHHSQAPNCVDGTGPVEHGHSNWHMYSPVRSRNRGRRRPMDQEAYQMMGNELMSILGSDLHTNFGTDLDELMGGQRMPASYVVGPGRRRRGRTRNTGVMAGIMFSPSAEGDDYESLMDLGELLGDVRQKGLSQSDSSRLPTLSYKKQEDKTEECHICMTEYEDGDSQKMLPCFHSYHAACINKWILKNATCPVCRVEVKLE